MKMFGAVLRGIREFRKLKASQVAQQVGMSSSTISSIEAGAMPQMATYLKLCKWMGIKASVFLDADDDIPLTAEAPIHPDSVEPDDFYQATDGPILNPTAEPAL